ncbi:hypothetical protein G9A89_020518 [Geosiphon pyriformis]|nr:hypothetical protein G9A89_020518 [Geosiphon pyriformis]
MRKVTLESPEEFKTSLKTFAEAEDSSKLSAHKHKIRHDPLKKRPLVPSSHSQHSLSTHPTPKIANDQSTNRDNFRTDFEDGPKIDTNYIISGYQQRQGPTRKRALISSDQDFITFSTPLPQSTQLAYNKNEFPINNYNEFSTLPPLDFGHPYKANSLLGKLRQKYEAVQKEKVIPVSSKPSSPISKSLPSTNRLNNLFEFLFGSINTDTIKFIIYCILWYASSAVTNNIGKQILNHFRYPITLTWIQFGFVVIYCYGFANLLGLSHIKSPTKHILIETIPLSLFQILGHVFSSVATSHVPVSFVHTIKALSPLFTVLLYRFAFRVNYSSAVYISLMPLTIGVMLACSSHSTSNFIGFIFAMGSTLIFVVQNIFSKKLLFNQDHGSERKKLDKLNLLFYSSTFAFLFMTPMWIYYDGIYLFIEGFWPKHVHDPNTLSTNTKSGWTVAFYFFLNGTTHFVQNILAFSILAITSPVTYSIASLVKRIFVITASIIWFGQSTTMAQGVGICLTFGGLYMYNNAKRDVDKKEKKAREADEILLPLTRSENEVDFKKM